MQRRPGRLCTDARSKSGLAQRSGKAAKKGQWLLPVDCLLPCSTVCYPHLTLLHMCHAAAEGEGYGSGKAYGNSSAYLAFAGLQTGLAGLTAALPESVRPARSGVLTACLAPRHHVPVLVFWQAHNICRLMLKSCCHALQAHELLFGVAGGPYTAPLLRILACGLLAASTSCLVQAVSTASFGSKALLEWPWRYSL